MYYDRGALKRNAKGMIRKGNPAVWLVTLVFLLVTDWVSEIADLVTVNPLNTAMEAFTDMAGTLYLEDGTVSDVSVNLLQRQIMSAFSGTAAMVGLLVALIILFYTMVVSIGYYSYVLRIMRGQEGGISDLFSRFYMAAKIIWMQILQYVFIFLWSMLFLIPGIVAMYRYRMAGYILIDNPDISALEAIRRSKAMMRGNKFELFTLDISFIGWYLLSYLLVNVVYNLGYLATGSLTAADLFSLAVSTVYSLFFFSYRSLACAGYYLVLTARQMTPADEQSPNGPGNFF